LNSRFLRNYELLVRISEDDALQITNLRVDFDIHKSISETLNEGTIRIYNLSRANRDKIKKDESDKKSYLQVVLKAGYSQTETIFQGNITEAFSERQGTDFLTTINCQDGHHDLQNAYTSKTLSNSDIEKLITDCKSVQKGKITPMKKSTRPRVYVGSTLDVIKRQIPRDSNFYIDEEKLYIIKKDEVIDDKIAVVSAETGLLNTPTKKNKELSFVTLLNPAIKLGSRIDLQSLETSLNGVYRVDDIRYTGDSMGGDWMQECICSYQDNWRVL